MRASKNFATTFTGITPHDPRAVARAVADCKFDMLATNLANRVKSFAPDMVDTRGFVKNPKHLLPFLESLFEPIKAPIDYLTGKKALSKEAKLLQRAARGIYQNSAKFLKENKAENIMTECGEELCRSACKTLEDGFYGVFAQKLSPTSSKYGTQNERALNRLVTGSIPALFLGADFYNKSIRDGKSKEDAKEEAAKKRGQELLSTVGEAYTQYAILGGFPMFINSSLYVAPAINTTIGLFFNVASRLKKGMPLTFVKIPKTPRVASPKMKNFVLWAKNPKGESPLNDPLPEPKEGKKHILTLKNVALFCGASVLGGMALKFGVKPLALKLFKKQSEFIKNIGKKELWVSQKDLEPFYEVLEKSNNNKTYTYYYKLLQNEFNKDPNKSQILLGKYDDTLNFFGVDLMKKDLCQIPLAPFKLVWKIVSFPYSIVSNVLSGFGVKAFKPEKKALKDPLNGAIEFYTDFKRQAKKFKENTQGQGFLEHYKKHLEQNTLLALDMEGNSKVDNSKAGLLTQVFGTTMSLYFATLDDFNGTAKRTGNMEKAERDARERGLNKFFRITSQIVLMDIFNGVLKIPYMQSLLASLGISAVCTFATETVSRALSGMPSKKMHTQEEVKAYKQRQKEGAMGWYFKLIDKLSD